MEVLVTGASGVLGVPVLYLLRERGHRVRALARSDRAEAIVRSLDAEPVRCELFDPSGLRSAAGGCQAVLHLATRIPTGREAGRAEAWIENDRIRSEGTRLVVDAALAAGVAMLVYPSVVFVYPDGGSEWLDASGPTDPPPNVRSTLVAEAEVARFTAGGGRGVVLRMGGFYGPTVPSSRELVRAAREEGRAALVGPDDAYQALIWVEDAAAAVVAGMSHAPPGVYDVVDDRPLTRRELAEALAAAVGRDRVERPAGGPSGTDARSRSQRVSNRAFQMATGWVPSVPDAREGLRRVAGS